MGLSWVREMCIYYNGWEMGVLWVNTNFDNSTGRHGTSAMVKCMK